MWPLGGLRFGGGLGRRGELLARKLLKRKGMKILSTNYRCGGGEVDLIALDGSTRRLSGAATIVFVEVKTRSSDRYTDPESAVNRDKQRRLRKAAEHYLCRHEAEDFNVRFDIVSIVMARGRETLTRHIEDAF